ncbi:MAG: NAD(P)H-binding protein, partial [Bacteroidetes bacterium]|nr:NAD(P)H-binding protein [Bacteroidota bacterium]
MKLIVTGSLGNISRPLTEILVAQGHEVTVISSDVKKQAAIEALGALAAIGSIADVAFLTATFQGADAVYAMIPLSFTEPDLGDYLRRMAKNYLQALKTTQVRRVVVMSGWVADLLKSENVENGFAGLEASITFMRPGSFYTNFYQS